MIITYFGKQFFKISQGDLTVAFNPISKDSKFFNSGKFGSDIALVTTNHPDYNGIAQLSHGEREPFVISGPGDYEVKEIFVKGSMSESEIAGKKFINTIYSLAIDGINIVFLGALSNADISKEAREAINEPDVLFIPVGGKDMLDPKSAAKLAASLEPKLIIPMDYDKDSLKIFLKEAGDENKKPEDKLTLKRKDLEGKEGEVVILEAN
ncbi:MAG: MBL fold metallo-hydrolase [Candidatus Nomurabacteria bacterium]|nr:MBL fold metallo-hydrolase [Candidatus Nomurabacteria bacterium]